MVICQGRAVRSKWLFGILARYDGKDWSCRGERFFFQLLNISKQVISLQKILFTI
jgi:hypothetical protein